MSCYLNEYLILMYSPAKPIAIYLTDSRMNICSDRYCNLRFCSSKYEIFSAWSPNLVVVGLVSTCVRLLTCEGVCVHVCFNGFKTPQEPFPILATFACTETRVWNPFGHETEKESSHSQSYKCFHQGEAIMTFYQLPCLLTST